MQMNRRLRLPLNTRTSITVPIATKLILGFVIVIIMISVVFMLVGVQIINARVLAEAQEKVRNDLNAAREIYLSEQQQVTDAVQYHAAERFFLRDAILNGEVDQAIEELQLVQVEAGLDVLGVTNQYGEVLLRASNPELHGDNLGHDELIRTALWKKEAVGSTVIIAGEDLTIESPYLAEQAYFKFIDTPLTRQRPETEDTAGMMLRAAAPIFDEQKKLIGAVYGGVLLNRNHQIVDKVKQTVYEDLVYEGTDIGTATIFQDDVRITTNVKNEDGSRALGTRVSEEVYNQVVVQGEPWIGRAYVVNNWFITAYEPIKNVHNNKILGILYVGVLEQKYVVIRRQTTFTFLGITFGGALISLLAAYFISRRISIPIQKLVTASKSVAMGNLDAQVDISTSDELQVLAESFNAMALALKKRDEQLRDYATQRIMESERLALIGQLSANVAHELNNPLQGIVTYSHLLLEELPGDAPGLPSVQKIVGQANRCRDIIRGLLDFSRQRKPDKTLSNVNAVLEECISLLKDQAPFHNIYILNDLQEDLPLTVIDPSQIERVFVNIIINAAEAMDGNGQLILRSSYDSFRETIEIEITDTGHGISEENLEKIFDPFFTTKDVGHGTGLGLAISYGIVKRHRGTVSVDSEIGKGTTFRIGLPVITLEENAVNDKIAQIAHH
jgi:two-component system NtrC family sensor kinase